jgi:hypothetical protein
MGSASMIVGEVVASAACGGVPTLASATGDEVALPSTAPRGIVAVRTSSARASPTTCGSDDLVREGEDGVPCPPCSLITDLHGKTPRKDNNLQKSTLNSKTSKDFTSSQLEVETSAKTPEA